MARMTYALAIDSPLLVTATAIAALLGAGLVGLSALAALAVMKGR